MTAVPTLFQPTRSQIFQAGDLIEVVGLLCLQAGEIRLINADEHGELYIFCYDGKHYLEDMREGILCHCITLTKIR